MTLTRRTLLQTTGAAVAVSAASRIARARTYPTQPVHLIVGLAAGGGVDIMARLMGQWLSEQLGQPFVIENRPGAGTNVATEFVVRGGADGYTLLQVATPSAINATLYSNLPFNFIRDIAPVASIGWSPLAMVVNPSFPAAGVPEFIAYARAHPGKIDYASSGIGTPLHLAGELFKMATGISMVHVPYKGAAPAVADLLGGQVQVMFSDMSALPLIKAGRLRVLAVTSATRASDLPEVPTIADVVPGYEAIAWQGIGGPKNTPAEIVATLNSAINAGLADPKMQARIADLGYTPVARSPAEFGKFIADETEKWARVIRAGKIKVE
jgi:tripartite-type tricarboxylate transporter receptor subunit TctC